MAIENRKARFDYEILDTYIAGISLLGWEVKSIRAGSANLKSAWIVVKSGEAFLDNFSISPWKFSREIQEEKRSRKLLLHKKELKKLETKANEQGNTIIPLKIFDLKNSFLLLRNILQEILLIYEIENLNHHHIFLKKFYSLMFPFLCIF